MAHALRGAVGARGRPGHGEGGALHSPFHPKLRNGSSFGLITCCLGRFARISLSPLDFPQVRFALVVCVDFGDAGFLVQYDVGAGGNADVGGRLSAATCSALPQRLSAKLFR